MWIRGLLASAALCSLLIGTSAPALGASPAAPGDRRNAAQTEQELSAIREQIERVRQQLDRDAAQRDQLARELRRSETSVAAVRSELDRLRRERGERNQRRAQLGAERRDRERELSLERDALAGQLRAAYLIGREEPLKLLLNQRDPARAGRMFAYYGYFGRARAQQIERIEENVARLGELDAALAAEEQSLVELERRQTVELQKLEAARAERGKVLVTLKSESRSRAANLARLQQQQAALERLLRELKRTAEQFPVDSKAAFARLRGKLGWPVAGRLIARFGETRAGKLKWEGMLLATERGAPVRSVYHGRIAYADWLAGLGLLVIVDHGGGYLSLYGHNDSLYKQVGERVSAGDTIAAAGDSGGRPQTQLYFEIRRGGKPVDPRPWFRNRTPAP
jgi:septal ring factor EnvC (AmiA/AmiB activator)